MPDTVTRTVVFPIRTPSAKKAGKINWSMKEFLRARKAAAEFFDGRDPNSLTLSDETDACHWMRDERGIRFSWKKMSDATRTVRQNIEHVTSRRGGGWPEPSRTDLLSVPGETSRMFHEDGVYYLHLRTGKGRVVLPMVASEDSYHQDVLPDPDAIPDFRSPYESHAGQPLRKIEEENLPDGIVRYGTSTLHKRGTREYELHLSVVYEVTEPPVEDPEYVIGVDRGRNQLAHAAVYNIGADHVEDWWNRSGSEVEHTMDEISERVREFQRAGVWEEMEKLRARRRRFKEHVDHEISRSIVELASDIDGGVVVALEELPSFRGAGGYSVERRRFSEWSQGRLQRLIEQKCEEKNIPVVEVDASYTSQECSRCGSDDTDRSGIHFTCRDCDYQQHADANAAVNIAKRAAEEHVDA